MFSGQPPKPEGQTYLVADDHGPFRHIVRDFLPGDSVEVIEVDDGAAAIAAYRIHQPDWALLDIQMPGVDGLAAARVIRAEFRDARIILLIECDSPELREAAAAAGAIACVLKDRLRDLPVVITALLQRPSKGSI